MLSISDRGMSGQVQIIAAIVFLFLIPTTMIIAENATNSSNTSFEIPETFPNLSLEGNLVLNTSDIVSESPTIPTNLTTEPPVSNESSETNTLSKVDEEPPTNQTLNKTTPLNETVNQTDNNQTLPGNETLNVTEPVNETTPLDDTNQTDINQTLPETNITQPDNETRVTIPEIPPLIGIPELTVSIQGPYKITRGQDPAFSAEITNIGNGTAFQIDGFWIIPYATDQPAFFCEDLETGESCTQEIVIPTSVATPTGLSDITLEVAYHG